MAKKKEAEAVKDSGAKAAKIKELEDEVAKIQAESEQEASQLRADHEQALVAMQKEKEEEKASIAV